MPTTKTKMSACRGFRSLLAKLNYPPKWCATVSCKYSRYSPNFQEPLKDPAEIESFLKNKTASEIKYGLWKPPDSDQTCSVFYYEDIRKFIRLLMKQGKKAKARGLVEKTLTFTKHSQLRKYYSEKNEEEKKLIIINPVELFSKALDNLCPVLSITRIKKGGSWYQVPMGVSSTHARWMAMKWVIETASTKDHTVPFHKKLSYEIVAASQYEGRAIQKKLELHKLCEANRANINLRWT